MGTMDDPYIWVRGLEVLPGQQTPLTKKIQLGVSFLGVGDFPTVDLYGPRSVVRDYIRKHWGWDDDELDSGRFPELNGDTE